jgi:uncharacterized protein
VIVKDCDSMSDLTRPRQPGQWRSRALTVAVFMASLVAGFAATLPISIDSAKAQEAQLKSRERSLSITASGQVTAAPDMVSITTGVLAEAETAKQAVDANSAAMRNVIAVLKAAGIADRDVQTADFSVQPKYVYPQDGSNTPPKLVGYIVTNQVTIRVREIKSIGDVLDKVVQAGSNQIAGITFGVSNADALLDKARQSAVAAARRKAEIYAEAAGVKLGAVLSISEASQSNGPQPMRQMAMAEKSSSVPVEAGEMALAVDVTMVWALD